MIFGTGELKKKKNKQKKDALFFIRLFCLNECNIRRDLLLLCIKVPKISGDNNNKKTLSIEKWRILILCEVEKLPTTLYKFLWTEKKNTVLNEKSIRRRRQRQQQQPQHQTEYSEQLNIHTPAYDSVVNEKKKILIEKKE